MTGNAEGGYNRELIISLFRDVRILHRILDGQARNDAEWYVLRSRCRNTKVKSIVQLKAQRSASRLHGPSDAHFRGRNHGHVTLPF